MVKMAKMVKLAKMVIMVRRFRVLREHLSLQKDDLFSLVEYFEICLGMTKNLTWRLLESWTAVHGVSTTRILGVIQQ